MSCAYARVSEVPTPSDPENARLEEFLELRDSLRVKRVGRGGREVCQALTSSLDVAVKSLVSPVDSDARFAIVAVGGYGRAELSPYSDVDLMVLHDSGDPSHTAAMVFRPLWDAGLRVGHAVRTVKETATAAKERVETHTTLLTNRLVAGDEDLFQEMSTEIAAVTKARPLRRHLVADERRRRAETPHLLMSTDVKTGRGGLRILHGFDWERRREALIGRFSTPPGPEEEVAAESLLRIRNALHATTGRSQDVFALDLREPVARWLDMGVYETAQMLVEAMQTVDRLASQRWPEATEDQPAGIGRRVWSRLLGTTESIGDSVPLAVDDFVEVLRSGERGRLAFERLWESGRLRGLIPEWEVVAALPQLAPFHEHPVDAHLWRTVEEMRRLLDGEDKDYASIADELDAPAVLLLAAFLHDIGKGHGGDHANAGAEIARNLCLRLECSPETTSLVEAAVRHHLLLAQTATRRDLDDPAVIDEVASTLGQLRLLQVVYLLTVADSRATGPSMWNEWKATLLRTVFVRCAGRFGAEELEEMAAGTTRELVREALGDDHWREAAAHLDGMPVGYLRSSTSEDVIWHLDLIDGLEGRSNLGVRFEAPVERTVVVGRSRPGFRRLVAESLAANGIDVLEARLWGRADGMIVDTFRVRDDRTGGRVSPERWDRARSDIEAALSGDLDTESKVAARAAVYSSPAHDGSKVRADVSVDAASGDVVITVRCSDRVGRLAQILTALHAFHLEIRLAKLDSRGGELVDTFHVESGVPLDDPDELIRLGDRIAASIEP